MPNVSFLIRAGNIISQFHKDKTIQGRFPLEAMTEDATRLLIFEQSLRPDKCGSSRVCPSSPEWRGCQALRPIALGDTPDILKIAYRQLRRCRQAIPAISIFRSIGSIGFLRATVALTTREILNIISSRISCV